jgi:hypothetical protein
MDFSGILDGLSAATANTAIIGGAAILALVGFTIWASRKVAGLFGK